MVGDLVSDADLEDVLARIIVSAARTISAPVFVLALEALPAADKLVYAAGVGDVEAERLATSSSPPPRRRGRTISLSRCDRTAVATAGWRRSTPPARFFPQERIVLQVYARLVAAALDSAAALEDARRQAETARALLELSNSLADIATTDEMAVHIARRCRA